MSLKGVFRKGAIQMFNAFGDVIENVTLNVTAGWDPVTEAGTVTNYPVRAAIKTNVRDKDGIVVGALDIAIIQSELSVAPLMDNTISFDGRVYKVVNVINAASVVWKLRVVLL